MGVLSPSGGPAAAVVPHAGPCDPRCDDGQLFAHYEDCEENMTERKRRPEEAFQAANGRRTGGGPRGWSGGVKGTGDFVPKSPYLM